MPAFSITDIVAAYHGSTRIAACYHGANRIPFSLTEPQDFAADLLPGDAPSRPSGFAAHVNEGVALADPDWDKVLLRMSDSFTPDSESPVTMATVGTTQLEATTVKFGSASFSCSSASLSYIEAVFPTAPLGASSNPWTIEFWFYLRSNPTDSNDCLISSATAYTWQPAEWQLRFDLTTRRLQMLTGGGLSGAGTTSVQLNRWYHLAINHVPNYGGVTDWTDVYLDGQQEIGWGDTVNRTERNLRWNTNRIRSTSMNNIYDDIRVTSGVARYLPATNFNPPTAAHPVTDGKPLEPTGFAIDLDNVISTLSAPQEFAADLTDVSTATDPYYSDTVLLLQDSLADESYQGQTVVASGSAALSTTARVGNYSIQLPDVNSYVTIASDASLQFGTNDFTVEGWFYFSGGSSQKNFLDFRGRGTYTATNQPVFYIHNNRFAIWAGSVVLQSSTTLALNTWYHLAVSRQGSSLRFFLDGQLNTTATNQAAYTCGPNVALGGTLSAYGMTGFVDGLRFTNGTARYTAAFTPPTSAFPATNGDSYFSNVSLLLQDSLADESPQGQTLVASGNTALSTTQVKVGSHSIYFDDTGDRITTGYLGGAFAFGTGDYTVESWIYIPSHATTRQVRLLSTTNSSSNFSFEILSTGALRVWTGSNLINFGGTAVTQGAWHHVAFCRASNVVRAFVDGNQIGSDIANSTNMINNQSVQFPSTDAYPGPACYLDSFRITNGHARYTAAFTPPTAPFPS